MIDIKEICEEIEVSNLKLVSDFNSNISNLIDGKIKEIELEVYLEDDINSILFPSKILLLSNSLFNNSLIGNVESIIITKIEKEDDYFKVIEYEASLFMSTNKLNLLLNQN